MCYHEVDPIRYALHLFIWMDILKQQDGYFYFLDAAVMRIVDVAKMVNKC